MSPNMMQLSQARIPGVVLPADVVRCHAVGQGRKGYQEQGAMQ